MAEPADAAAVPDAPRAWEHVLQHIEAQLLAGLIGPGDRLLGERALSAELGVSRSSVREALRALEVLGLIRTATGSGPNSGAIITSTPQGGMSSLMRLQVAAHGFPVADLVATRVLLEVDIAEQLAERTGGGGGDLLEAATLLLDAMEATALSAPEFLALDAEFHLALALASGNQVVAAIMAGLRSGIERYAVAGVNGLDDWAAMAELLAREHRGIVAAIAAGDVEAAGARIHSHIVGYYAATEVSDATPDRPSGGGDAAAAAQA